MIPSGDDFDQGAWNQDQPLEYLRGDFEGTGATVNWPFYIYDQTEGRLSATSGARTTALWRRIPHGKDVKVSLQFKFSAINTSPILTSACIARASIATYNESTVANKSDFFNTMTAYYVWMRNTGSISLIRQNSGTQLTLVSANVTVLANTLHTIAMTITTNSADNPVLTVQFDGADVTGLVNIEDTSASKITTLGHSGFMAHSENSIGNTWVDFFKIEEPDLSTVYLQDDFQRLDGTLITYGGVIQPALMWEFGDLAQAAGTAAPAYSSNRLVFSGTTAPLSGPMIDLYQRPPDGMDQKTGALVKFKGGVGFPGHGIGVVCRGSKSSQGLGTSMFTGYLATLEDSNPGTLRIVRYNAGTSTELAQMAFPVDWGTWYRLVLDVATSGTDAIVTVSVDGTAFIVVTDTSPVTQIGMQGIFADWKCNGTSCANSGILMFDKFKTVATSPAAPMITVEPASAGPLGFEPEAPAEITKDWQVQPYKMDGNYMVTFPKFRRGRRVWKGVRWLLKKADAITVKAFLEARLKDGKPFDVPEDGANTTWFLRRIPKIPAELLTTGQAGSVWQVGPVDLVERLDPQAVP